MRNTIRILLGALYRPHDLIDLIQNNRGNLWLAVGIAVLIAISSAILATASIFIVSSALSTEVIGAILAIPFLAGILSGIAIMITPPHLQLRLHTLVTFWLVVTQATITPFLLLGFTVIVGLEPTSNGLLTTTQIGLLIFLFGIGFGKVLNVVLVLHQRSRAFVDQRWMVVIGLPVLAIILWFTPQTRTIGPLAAIVIFGIVWAQLRFGAWLWQAWWTLLLVSATAVTKRTYGVAHYYPACFDQMRLLPLPGTTAMLRQQSHASSYRTADWIARLVSQPSDRWLAQRFVLHLSPSPQTYAILFWLSVHPDGQTLLQSISESHRYAPIPLQAFAHLSRVYAPGAWRLKLEQYAQVLISCPTQTDLSWIPTLISSAQIILEGRRWEHVQRSIIASYGSSHNGTETIDELLIALRVRIYDTLDAHTKTPPDILWPVRLLDTAAEQVAFLKNVE